jgi:serine-type D-Ala-D-Ala carboxypeptidase (penicillin-binding protein 5/6)
VLATAHVWKALNPSVDLGIKDDLYMTVPRGETDIKTAADVPPRLIAPLAQDAAVGSLRVFAGGQTLTTLPLHPLKDVAGGSWWHRLIDTVRLWFA